VVYQIITIFFVPWQSRQCCGYHISWSACRWATTWRWSVTPRRTRRHCTTGPETADRCCTTVASTRPCLYRAYRRIRYKWSWPSWTCRTPTTECTSAWRRTRAARPTARSGCTVSLRTCRLLTHCVFLDI